MHGLSDKYLKKKNVTKYILIRSLALASPLTKEFYT